MAGFLKGMFGGKAKSDPEKPSPSPEVRSASEEKDSPSLAAMKRAVAEKAKTDPTAPLTFTIEDVLASILEATKDSRGVKVETILGLIGSLAGYSCHVAARSRLAQMTPDELNVNDYLELGTKAGTTLYFGNLINRPLAEANSSVWQILVINAQRLGATRLPDVNEIFKHVTRTGGTPEFGIPRMPAGQAMADLPVNFVTHVWPKYAPLLSRYSVPVGQWPVVWAGAGARAMQMAKDVTAADVCVTILMENAVPASKLPLLPTDAASYPLPAWWGPFWEAMRKPK
jgi:hypothetical protein